MKCPVDNETLVMTERSGVEIDYCPRCRGVWLDRGELDKIIDRGSASAAAPAAAPEAPRPDYRESHSPPGPKPYRTQQEPFPGELFDFCLRFDFNRNAGGQGNGISVR